AEHCQDGLASRRAPSCDPCRTARARCARTRPWRSRRPRQRRSGPSESAAWWPPKATDARRATTQLRAGPPRAGGPRRSYASGPAAKPLVDSCGGHASAAGGQRRTVAARGEWLPDLILARLRIREVQALEVVGIGDRDLEPRRVGVDELAGGKEQAELLLPRRAPGQARIREPAVRIG